MAEDIFLVGVPPQFEDPEEDLSVAADELTALERSPGIKCEYFDENLGDYDAILNWGIPITGDTFAGSSRLSAIALLGVGFDHHDVCACTDRGAVVFNAPDGVRRPMAQATLALLLALSTRMLEKDRAVRSGAWRRGKIDMGVGLIGRTLGLVGAGNIGAEVFRVASPLGMRYLAYDPHAKGSLTDSLNVSYVDLPTLLKESDFISIHTPLNEETRGLIGKTELCQMKPSAYLINTARGGIVDQNALVNALEARAIAGAGLDVVDPEPPGPGDPIRNLPNTIVTPHNLGETDDLIRGGTRQAIVGVLEVAYGRIPANVVNPDVLSTENFQAKLGSYRQRMEQNQLARGNTETTV